MKKSNDFEGLRTELLSRIVESGPTAILVVDMSGVIVLSNAQTENYFGYSRQELIGKQVEILIPRRLWVSHRALREGFQQAPESRAMGVGRDLCAVRKDGSDFPVEVGLNPIDIDGDVMVLTTIVDITKRKQLECEREKLIAELEDALARIKTLSGLLPICAGCKKIRDDKGYWNQIEEYITEHSDAMFSHSICPDCQVELYGDL